ncbi:MAG: hypothetical protein AAFW73_23950 [Bacteroidota bacterium]
MSLKYIFAFLLGLGLWPGLGAQDATLLSATPTENLLPAKQVLLFHESQVDPAADEADELLDEASLADEVFQLKLLLRLFNTQQVAAIRVVLRNDTEGDAPWEQRFVFDQSEGLAPGLTYARDAKTVVLGLGEVLGYQPRSVEVILEGKDGRLSEPRYYLP